MNRFRHSVLFALACAIGLASSITPSAAVCTLRGSSGGPLTRIHPVSAPASSRSSTTSGSPHGGVHARMRVPSSKTQSAPSPSRSTISIPAVSPSTLTVIERPARRMSTRRCSGPLESQHTAVPAPIQAAPAHGPVVCHGHAPSDASPAAASAQCHTGTRGARRFPSSRSSHSTVLAPCW